MLRDTSAASTRATSTASAAQTLAGARHCAPEHATASAAAIKKRRVSIVASSEFLGGEHRPPSAIASRLGLSRHCEGGSTLQSAKRTPKVAVTDRRQPPRSASAEPRLAGDADP